MKQFYKLCLLALTFNLTALYSQSGYSQNRDIVVESGELSVKFGEPFDITLRLEDWFEGNVQWTVFQNSLPIGARFESLGRNRARLTGINNFLGYWISTFTASVQGQPTGIGSVIIKTLDNDLNKYPKLIGERTTLSFDRWRYSANAVQLDENSITDGQGIKQLSIQIVKGSLPSGIRLVKDLDVNQIVIAGTTNDATGSSEIVLKLVGVNGTVSYVNMLYIISLNTDCPEGEYYDYLTNTCREYIACPTGYIYDRQLNRCVVYRLHCPRGYYYDSLTETCLRLP